MRLASARRFGQTHRPDDCDHLELVHKGTEVEQRYDWHLTERIHHENGRGDPFAAAIRATRMPMVITDPRQDDNPIVFVNEAFQKLTGYAREEIVGRNCRFLQGPDTDPDSVERLRTAIETETDVQVDLLNYRKDGTTFWNALYLSPTRSHEGEVQFFFASQLDISDRVESQRVIAEQKAIVEAEVQKRTLALEEALAAKDLLLHEVDHRVKNNLTMIGSLLRLQSRQIGDPVVSSKLDAMLERVDALATVHRRLYQSDDVTRFDVGTFTGSLVHDVIGASGRADIKVDADVDRLDISSSKAAALGLIINELVTNTVKHAFANDRPGHLHVSAKAVADQAVIRIADDGYGMAAKGERVDGLGTTLVNRLCRQVQAVATWDDARPGTSVTLTFPISE
ncbi:PAS domain-containing protein [Lichenihabitans sp. Uapishka_5]|uniref:PAS domain-containing protein n=1 Tax=Lichenihabitans sp. Uapishka_5 TaxID=3037302 RepID=UPI0029E81CE1|nr:PAS domain-containing protein [Lichenihabitans sp. Uapishka_5]MDX7953660.1 PAS domain-containing protein [Lichenihabitans sp. Uapishka_5]